MNIKEILLSGGSVSFSYKETVTEWLGTATITSFCGGYGMNPSINVNIPTGVIHGRKSFKYDEVDKAITLFETIVFCEKNIWYKHHEAMIESNDPDIEEDNNRINNIRKKIINDEKQGKIML